MEEGEIQDNKAANQGVNSAPDYDPSMEWPGDGSEMPSTSSSALFAFVDETDVSKNRVSTSHATSPLRILRLCISRSSVLPKTQTLAILDGYSEVQIGRDAPSVGSTLPRLRLKEMEVSKLHATIFWDKSRREWAIVDMGSKHGTFHHPVNSLSGKSLPSPVLYVPSPPHGPGPSNWQADARGTRLSPPRIASVPRSLAHGDSLAIGCTTFTVHIHAAGMPCAECTPSGSDEISLLSLLDHRRGKKRKRPETDSAPAGTQPTATQDPKKAMTILKRDLLSRHTPATPPTPDPAHTPYVDRSARRRAFHPDTQNPLSLSRPITTTSTPMSSSALNDGSSSVAATPLPSTNIGHQLLMKQGWQPGSALGLMDDAQVERGSVALTEPLNISGNLKRSGLGMPVTPMRPAGTGGSNWKEEARLRRWGEMCE